MVLPTICLGHIAQAQQEDTTVWQSTGRGIFGEEARRDSAVARSFFRYVRQGDFHFLNVPDYGDGAIGMWRPAERAVVLKYGSRMYADSDLDDEHVRQWKYYEPYHFAEYFNAALYNFLQAPDSFRLCFVRQTGPYGSCLWTPLPASHQPPPERPLVQASEPELAAMLDAALTLALTHVERHDSVALDGELGSDGPQSLARKGQQPASWLESVLARHKVSCIRNWAPSPPCSSGPTSVTIRLNQPREDYHKLIVIHTSVLTDGPGLIYGRIYDAQLTKTAGGWTATSEDELIVD